MSSGNTWRSTHGYGGVVVALFMVFALSGQAYALNISNIFSSIPSVIGAFTAAAGSGPVIYSLSVVSPPSAPGSDFKVKVCGIFSPFSPPILAQFAIDSTSNVVSVQQYTLADVPCGVFTLTAPESSGYHTVYASVADSDGQWSLWKDTTFYVPSRGHEPQIVSLQAPSNVYANQPFTVTVSVKDVDGDLNTILVKMDDFEKYVSVSGSSATKTVDMPGFAAGSYTLHVAVYDRAGHFSVVSKDIQVSPRLQHKPTIDSISVSSGITAGQPFNVTVRATDPDGDLRLIGVSVGEYNFSKEVDGADETVRFTIPGLSPGEYTLTVFAQDSMNNRVTSEVAVTVPTPNEGPSVSLSVRPSSVYVGNAATISASASSDRGMKSISIYVDDKFVGSRNCKIATVYPEFCSYELNYVPHSAGAHTVKAVARDIYGYTATGSVILHALPRPHCVCQPHVSLVSPSKLYVGDSARILVEGNVSYSGYCEHVPSVVRLVTYVDGNAVKTFDCSGSGLSCGPHSFQYAFNAPGEYNISAQMVWIDCDGARQVSQTRPRIVDVIAAKPEINLAVSPSPAYVGSNVEITTSAEYPRGISKILVYFDKSVVGTHTCGGSTACHYIVRYTPYMPGDHNVAAVLVASDGQRFVKATTLSVRANVIPKIKMSVSSHYIAPDNNVVFTAKGQAPSIRSISIFVDGRLKLTKRCGMNTMCTARYTTSFHSGIHTAYANMGYVDVQGLHVVRSNTVAVQVLSPPTAKVSLKAIPASPVPPGTWVVLAASAESRLGIQRLVFHVDGKVVDTESCGGHIACAVSYAEYFYAVGTHRAYVTAYYGQNGAYEKNSNVVLIVVRAPVNHPPVVYELNGPATAYVDSPYTVTVCAKDVDGNVIRIEAWMDHREKQVVAVDSPNICKRITLYAPLTVGTHTVYARAEDNNRAWSSTASRTFTAVKRNVPPTARVIPSQSTVIPGATFNYRVCGTDPDGRVVRVAGRVDDSTWQYELPDSDGCAEFHYRAPVKETDLTLYGKVEDNGGAWSKIATAKVHVRYVPPILYASVPSQISVGERVSVQVTAKDLDGDLNTIGLVVYDSFKHVVAKDVKSVSGTAATVYLHFVVDLPGRYLVEVYATDVHGKESVRTYPTEAVHVNVPPTASVRAPSVVVPDQNFEYNVCGTDVDGHIVRVAARAGSSTWIYKVPGPHGCAAFVTAAPSSGDVTLYGKVEDNGGAWSKIATASVHVDVPPSVSSIVLPTAVVINRSFTISVSAVDPDADLSHVDLVVRSGGAVVYRASRTVSGSRATVSYAVTVHKPGIYSVTATAYDRMGLHGTKSAEFTAVLPPNRPPVVDSVRVLGDIYVNSPFELNVCAHDPDGSVEQVLYAISGGAHGAVGVGGNGCHVIKVPTPGASLGPGTYDMNVLAVDNRGARSAPYSLRILVRSREYPPTIVSYSFPSSVAVSREYNVTVTAADKDGDLSYAELNVYGTSGKLVFTSSAPISGYRATATLHLRVKQVGTYVAVIAVFDSKGASDMKRLTFRASDLTPPSVRVTGVREVNVPGDIAVSFVASDNVALREANIYVSGPGYSGWTFVDHISLTGATATETAGVPVRIPGEYNIMIAVSDTSGNLTRVYALGRAVDQIPPVVKISAPSDANLGEPYHFSVTVTDNYMVRSVIVRVDGNTIYSNSSVDKNYWFKEFTYYFPHASPHEITVIASDGASNVRTESHPVEVHVVDRSAPIISLDAWYDVNVPAVVWRAAASDPNLAEVNVYVNRAYVQSCAVHSGVAECRGQYDINAPGVYIVSVVAEDSYNNVARKSISVSVSDQPPTVLVSAPSSVATGAYASIFVSARDDFGLAHVDVNGYGVTFSEAVSGRTFEHEFNVFLPSEGNYLYTVRVIDTGGHAVEKNVTIVATRVSHTYGLILSKQNGAPARVWAEGKIDGKYTNLKCSDAVIHVVRTDNTTALAQYNLRTVDINGHKACEVDISGAGYYAVTVTWQGIQKSISVHAFKGVSSAPENPVVAVGVALLLLAIAARFI